MTAREFLKQAYKLDHRINSKLEQVSSLNDLALKATSTVTGMPRNPNHAGSKMSDAIINIIDLQDEINRDVDALVDIKREIMHVIKAVDNVDCQLLLEMRYLCYRTWEQIAVDMDFSIDNVFKVHRRALQMVRDILERVQ